MDEERLLFSTGFASLPELAEFYRSSISERLTAQDATREPCWIEAVAVGSEEFVVAAASTTAYRRHMQCYEVHGPPGDKAWAVRESDFSYNPDSIQKSAF